MIDKSRASALVFCFVISSLPATGQIPANKKTTSNSKTSSAEKRLAKVQRAYAIQMLTVIADEADKFKDETLRAQVQARAADTLWDGNQELSQVLFHRAWKVAERIDKENERLSNEALAKAMNSRDSGLVMLNPAASVRMDVIKLVAKRDSDFAEGFLEKLSKGQDEDKSSAPSRDNAPIFDPTEPSVAVAKRLEVATMLLERDFERATAFAEPGLQDVTSPGIIFLCKLRQNDRALADRLYSQMLMRAAGDSKSDATSVSLLTTYIFTPNLIVTATRRGRIMNPFADEKQLGDYSPELRSAFFRVAGSILLRPSPLPAQDVSSAGRAGTFFTIARLLPLFEQYSPSTVPALKTQMLMLTPDAPEAWKNEDDLMLRAGLVSKRPETEPVESLEQQLAKASSSAERDLLYLKAIQTGAGRGDVQIRNFAGKIEDVTLREQARTFADLAIVRTAVNTKDADEVLRIVREGYLAPLHRVWALATLASRLGTNDPVRAMDFLNEATIEARRIRVGDPTRAYALVCVAQSFIDLGKFKTEEIGFELVNAVNGVTDFNVDGGKLYAQIRARNLVAMINSKEPSFSMAFFFERLSKQDAQQAISLATDVKPDAPRAAVTIAIAGQILKSQNSAAVSLRN
jgi:hypothetical protein